MGQNHVRQRRQRLPRFAVRAANRSPRRVSAGHNQHVGHDVPVWIVEQQKMKRRVRKHDSQSAAVGSGGSRNLSPIPAPQNHDGLLRAVQHPADRRRYFRLPFRRRHIPRHNRKRLHRTPFSFPKQPYRRLVRRVAAEMETADPFDCGNPAAANHPPHFPDCLAAPRLTVQNVNLRPAIVAGNRLRVIPPRTAIRIFLRTSLAHGKRLHAGSLAVIRHIVENREPRAAARTVDERMQIAAIILVEQLRPARIAYCNIGRNETAAFGRLAFRDDKTVARKRLRLPNRYMQYRSVFRRRGDNFPLKRGKAFLLARRRNLHIRTFIGHIAPQSVFFRQPMHKRAKSHALYDAVYPQFPRHHNPIAGTATATRNHPAGTSTI